MRWHLISYDISDTKARNAVSGRLEKKGRRVQKSVFILECGPHAIKRLEQELQAFLAEGDSLLVLDICEHCLQTSKFTGEIPPLLEIL